MNEEREIEDAEDRRDLAGHRAGDPAAFARLFARHAARIHGLALRMLRRVDLAEDVVQETFLQLHRMGGTFRGESRLGTWLAAVAINACRMRLRSRRPVRSLEAAGGVAAREEVRESGALERALAALDTESRELLLLAAAGHSYEALGTILGISAGQVRGRLFRARKALLARIEVEESRDA